MSNYSGLTLTDCFLYCIEQWCVHMKTSETKSLDNRLEWVSLDGKVFQNSKQVEKT